MNTKRILALLVALVLAIGLTACGNGADGSSAASGGDNTEDGSPAAGGDSAADGSSEESGDAGEEAASASGNYRSIQEIQDSGELIMLTNAGFPPFEYVEGTEPVGVDVDVAREIAASLGVELNVVDMEFDGLIAALKSGKGDLIAAGMTVTEERKNNVDFTVEYITSAQFMIVREDSDIASIEDLAGGRVGVQIGTTGDFLMEDEIDLEDGALYGTDTTVSGYRTALEAAQDLLNGRLDAVVIDRHPATAIAEQNDGLKVADTPISESESYAIAVDKGNADLLAAANETLERLMSEGKIDEFLLEHTT